jgi:hypothetical protein
MPTVYSPPVSTYVPLATITLASTDSSIVFSSIPATYRDLVLIANRKVGSATPSEKIYLNGDTGANYTRVGMFGDGSNDDSYSGTNDSTVSATTTFSVAVYQFMDYSATDKHKTFLVRGGSASHLIIASAHRWANTSAVNSVTIQIASSSYSIGSTFSLYGIAS